jgi:two-component system phosphate regulon sensor histidine kinase PhoR
VKRRSFFWQIIPWIFGLSVLLGPISTYVSFNKAQKVLLAQIQHSLLSQAKTMMPLILERYDRGEIAGLNQLLQPGDHPHLRLSVVAVNGEVLAETDANIDLLDNHLDRPEMAEALQGKVGTSWRYSETIKQYYYYVAVPIVKTIDQESKTIAILRLATRVHQIDELMGRLFYELIAGGVIALVIALLFGILMARYLARPLERITAELSEHADKFSEINLVARENYPREIKKLIESINSMAQSIQRRRSKILKQESELQAVFSSLTEGVLTVDTQKNIFHFNQQFERLFHIPGNQLQKGKPSEEALPIAIIQDMIAEVLEKNILLEREWHRPDLDEENHFIIKGSPLVAQNGELMGVLIVVNDLTQMKKLESHRKDFVSNVGHELRTPLTAIQGYLETIVEGKVDDEVLRKKFLTKSLNQTIRLARLVDDLFRLAQIERDGSSHDIEMSSGNVCDVIAMAIEAIQGKAAQRQMQLEHITTGPVYAPMHAGLLELAVVNLLDNAIKYSPPSGKVTIECGKKNSRVFIQICDQGPGIDPIHRPRIFERFYCIDKARSREMGGTGIGLSLVKHIALVHGGDVEVGGIMGQGSVFTLWIKA